LNCPRNPLLLLLCLVLLSACATRPPESGVADRERLHEDRAARLLAWPGWSLTGRLGIQRGDEGGSGRLDWIVRGDRSRLDFRGTLGQGAWRLEVSPEVARLELKDGTVREARRVEDLVFDQTGWEAPVTALGWWVRGLAWPGGPAPARRELNPDGTLATLEQAGWRVDWTRYTTGADGQLLPSRLQLTRSDVSIKLAVSRWARSPMNSVAESAAGGAGDE
jgi:outer membrane lipoprotein LolB